MLALRRRLATAALPRRRLSAESAASALRSGDVWSAAIAMRPDGPRRRRRRRRGSDGGGPDGGRGARARPRGRIVISFRGSQSATQWYTNLKTDQARAAARRRSALIDPSACPSGTR